MESMVYTYQDICDMLGFRSKETIRRWILRGWLPRPIGKGRFLRDEVRATLRRRHGA